MDTELAVIPPIDNEEQIIYGEVSGAQYRHLTDPLHRSASGNIQNKSSVKKEVVLKHDGEFSFSKDFRLNTVSEMDNFKNFSNSTVKSEPFFELDPHTGFEDYQRQQEPSLSTEKTNHSYVPQAQQHSCNVHLLSTFLTQHRNHTLLPLNNWPCSGKAHHNVRLIPVLRQIVSPVTGGNNFICYEPWKEGMNNVMEQSPDLPISTDECFDGLHTTRSNGDDFAEVKSAVASITDGNKEQTDFSDQNVNEMNCKLLSSQEHLEAANSTQSNDSGSLVFCHLKGGTPLLCLNSPGSGELKQAHMVPQYQGQHNSIQLCPKKEDSSNQLTDMTLPTAVGRFLSGGAAPNLTFEQLDNGALLSLVNNAVLTNLQGPSKMTLARGLASSWDAKSKKPCNCTKSQCLKLYCDCFANGEFCSNCNCNNCYNNIQHELERFKAIKACLDRNPEAFQPKIGKGKLGDIKPRHNKGCNCKRSGCLKNYCECYEAKIMCSSICKCIGCKNYEESPDRKSLMNMPHCTETGRYPPTCISWEVVEATCACLLAQGEEAEKENYPVSLAEQMILEEFGSCLSQILHSEFKSKGLQIDQQLIN